MHRSPFLQRALEAPGGAGAASGAGAVAAADVPVRIRLLSVDALSTQISFQGDPFSRPRWVLHLFVILVLVNCD